MKEKSMKRTKIFFVILASVYLMIVSCYSNQYPISLDPEAYIGTNLPIEHQAAFKRNRKEMFGQPRGNLLRAMGSYIPEENIRNYSIFQQSPGNAFHTITPVHFLALLYSNRGNLNIFDAGSGNGYWSLLMASQGNNLTCVDTYPINSARNYQKILSEPYGTFFKNQLDLSEGDFVASLKKLHGNKADLDMILSFNSLHFLSPSRVVAFSSISYGALKEGGSIIGVANSCYGCGSQQYKGQKEFLSKFCEFQKQVRKSKFPGYVAEILPIQFTKWYGFEMPQLIRPSDYFVYPAQYAHQHSPQIKEHEEVQPNTAVSSNPSIDRMTGSEEIDRKASVNTHSFFKETLEEVFKEAGFSRVTVFYIDEKSNQVFRDIALSSYTPYVQEEHKKTEWFKNRLYNKQLIVGFVATK